MENHGEVAGIGGPPKPWYFPVFPLNHLFYWALDILCMGNHITDNVVRYVLYQEGSSWFKNQTRESTELDKLGINYSG